MLEIIAVLLFVIAVKVAPKELLAAIVGGAIIATVWFAPYVIAAIAVVSWPSVLRIIGLLVLIVSLVAGAVLLGRGTGIPH